MPERVTHVGTPHVCYVRDGDTVFLGKGLIAKIVQEDGKGTPVADALLDADKASTKIVDAITEVERACEAGQLQRADRYAHLCFLLTKP